MPVILRRSIRGFFLLTAGLIVLILAAPSEASLYLLFEPTGAPPGAVVRGHTVGRGAFATPLQRLSVYLAPANAANSMDLLDDPRLVPVGILEVDGSGNGTITFVVPDVRPGQYVTFVLCPSCARFSAGRSLLPAGSFSVHSRASPSTNAIGSSGDSHVGLLLIIGGAALAAVAVGSVIAVARR